MDKIDYINKAEKLVENKNSRIILLEQIERYYSVCDCPVCKHDYKVGDAVFLQKGTFLHGTYKNMEGLREIVRHGLIAGAFVGGRNSKYPFSVGVWNLKRDCFLKDYIDFYSGGTIGYMDGETGVFKTEVIPYSQMNTVLEHILVNNLYRWGMEQTKEARFMPSLVQEKVEIGIIFRSANSPLKQLLKGDILTNAISDEDVKPFIHKGYYSKFLLDRQKKDDFFTNRESAILFGIPTNFIEGILVGRKIEKDRSILQEIKVLLPWVYICNLDGQVIDM